MKMRKKNRRRVLFGLALVIGLPMLWSLVLAAAIVRGGSTDPDPSGDVAVVLGAAVWDAEPSPVFAARIDHAVDLFQQGRVRSLLFTGGKAEGDRLSEAEAAKAYAITKGVPERGILVENVSTSTRTYLMEAQQVMRRNGLRKAVIVSDPSHMLRAGMIADRIGLEHTLSATSTSRYRSFRTRSEQVAREAYYVTRLVILGD